MKKLIKLLLFTLLMSPAVYANEFDDEMPEYDTKPIVNDVATMHKRIQEDMELACEGSLCTFAQKDTHNKGWSVTFNFGEGSGNGMYGQGDTIIIGDANLQSQQFWGVSIRYENFKCASSIKIDKSFYRAIKLYAESMMNEDGSPKRTFYPAEQTTVLLYTTIMNNVESCRSASSGAMR